MDVIRSEIVHGVGIIWQDGQPIILAGPESEISDEDIAERAKALLTRRQWADLHHRLFGGLSPRALLVAVLAGVTTAIVVTALVMGVIWTGWHRPGGLENPPVVAGAAPAAAAPRSSMPATAPSTTVPPRAGVKAAGWQRQAQAAPTTTASSSSVPPTTTRPKVGPAVRDAVHQAQQTVKATRREVSSTASSIISDVDQVEETASSVVCRLLC